MTIIIESQVGRDTTEEAVISVYMQYFISVSKKLKSLFHVHCSVAHSVKREITEQNHVYNNYMDIGILSVKS